MSWSVGYDSNWNRDIGYGIPAICDHPDCSTQIDRGLSYVCGGEPYGGERGCGLYFCEEHLLFNLTKSLTQLCRRCIREGQKPFPAKPDTVEWIAHKLHDRSWAKWRKENTAEVEKLKACLVMPSCTRVRPKKATHA